MAGNTVTLTFAGDATSLQRAMGGVGSSAKSMAGDLDSASAKAKGFGSALDATGAAAGNSESKFMGTADMLDGLGGAFGLPTEGATGLMRAFGDLSGGFEVVQGMMSSGIGKLGEFASAVAHSSMVTKIWTGIQAAFNVVMALNPAILITAAIVALGVALVVAYQKSETFRNIVQGAFNAVKGAAEAVWGFIAGLPDKIAGLGGRLVEVITWPYKTAFNAVAGIWNSTVGKLSFSIPDWVPGLGGKGFSMPKIPEFRAMGGPVSGGSPYIVGERGPELFIPGRSGTIVPNGGGATYVTVNMGVVGDPAAAARQIVGLLQQEQRRSGNLGLT